MAQYLAGLTTQQDVWREAGLALRSFFGVDLVAFGERTPDDRVAVHDGAFADGEIEDTFAAALNTRPHSRSGSHRDLSIATTIVEVLDSGFLTLQPLDGPVPLSVAFLPIRQQSQVTKVMLVGHRMAKTFPKSLLDVYLGVASLVGTTATRLASERELRRHRHHLAELVEARTAALTATNTRLQDEIAERKRADARVAHLNRVLRAINNVNQLIVREPKRDEMLGGVCDILIETRGYFNVWLALFDADGTFENAYQAGFNDRFPALLDLLRKGELTRCGRQAYQTPGVAVTRDPRVTCDQCPLSTSYEGRGGMTVRLEHGARRYGLLCASIPQGLVDDTEEQVLLQEVAGDIAFALHDFDVTQQVRLEADRSAAILSSISDAFFALDDDLVITFFNDAAEAALSRSRDEVLGRPLFEAFPEAAGTVFEERYRRALMTGESDAFEIYFDRAPYENWYSVHVYPQAAGLSVYFQVVTERKRAEAALRESEERYRLLFDGSDVLVSVYDRTGVCRLMNQKLASLFGGVPEDFIGSSFADLHPDYGEAYTRRLLEVIDTGDSREYEDEVRFPTGARWLLSKVHAVRDAQGDIIAAQLISQDITDRRSAEIALAESEVRYRELFQRMPVGMYRTNAEGRILQANPALVEMLGYPDLETLLATDAADLYLDVAAREREAALIARDGVVRAFETRLRCYDGRVIWVQDSARIVEGAGRAAMYEGTLQDITARREARERERKVREELHQQERLAAVGQLAAGIAHDFNNIMAAIVLYAQIAANAPELQPATRERIEVINQQAWHATRLIEQILDFSRKSVLERHPIDLLSLVLEQADLLRRTIPENIRIVVEHDDDDYTVNADRTRMQQIITNLALNARDAMLNGGCLCIRLDRVLGPVESPGAELSAQTETWVRLVVSDTGTGIPTDVLPHIFEPFYTTKGPGQGSGLGLAQVHGIVGQHGGRVDVETVVGEGTAFTITLPALIAAQPDLPAPKLQGTSLGHGETILVVEDSPAVRMALVDSLEQLNYRVVAASHGREALDILAQNPEVSLVLSDLVMPEMGGDELFRALRDRGLTLPVVMLSGHPMEQELQGLKAEGLVGWLLKPPDIEVLSQLLVRALHEGAG